MFLTQENLHKLLCRFPVGILHVLLLCSVLHNGYAEQVAMFHSVTKKKTVFFKYRNFGQFEYIQGFLS